MNRPIPILGIGFILLLAAMVLPARQDPPANQDQDAAAKAVARKKHFEEMKKQLEEKTPQAPATTQAAAGAGKPMVKPAFDRPANIIFSRRVTMAVDDQQQFRLYDSKAAAPDVTQLARWTTSGDSDIAELSVIGGVPNMTGKKKGVVLLFGTLNDRTAEVQLTVVPREELKEGTVRWSQLPPTDKSPLFITPAVPRHTPH
jgi:hypothetical protein